MTQPFTSSPEIRRQFLDFFRERGHTVVPSSSVVPLKDPTLLFTNAGMNQFKDVFLGQGTRPYSRAVNSQKCIRVSGKHNDLEEVGRDGTHHTFFEMLGNWSFGDYYKHDAIRWAWELVTGVWKLPPERLYATVHLSDDEAEAIWRGETGVDPGHISRHGKDNFWEMGDTGPCGPCSEIHFDFGPGTCPLADQPGHSCGVNVPGCGRYIELWNLVFIQFNRDESGKLTELPAKHVDTGAGFERICSVLQGVRSNYDTDLFRPLITRLAEITGTPYDPGEAGVPHRVVADHVRSLSFALADGAMPSNEGRGYVLRRILRRAARFGRTLGVHRAFIWQLVDDLAAVMGEAYPELVERREHIQGVIRGEEESFGRTLDRGIELFSGLVARLKAQGREVLPGDEAFKLYDTFGFPLDLTELMAREQNLAVDREGFELAMEGQRERARRGGKFSAAEQQAETAILRRLAEGDTEFLGYTDLEAPSARVLGYSRDGDHVRLILDRTPFYAEAGGQVGDIGVISAAAKGARTGDGWTAEIEDTQRNGEDVVHVGRLVQGAEAFQAQAEAGFPQAVSAQVDRDRRLNIMRNHTATHLLQAALQQVLGKHIAQAGSLVHPDYLRFDFTHFEKPSEADLDRVEDIVNQVIARSLPVTWEMTDIETAKSRGAMALFGEKYGEIVRLVAVPGVSAELCGGTHVRSTDQVLAFRLTSESSAAAGIRRIEALTGSRALEAMIADKRLIRNLQDALGARGGNVLDKAGKLAEENRALGKQLEQFKEASAGGEVEALIREAADINGVRLVTVSFADRSMDDLKTLGDALREGHDNLVAVLGSAFEGRASLAVVVSDDLIRDRKLSAGTLVKEIAAVMGGGGGGRHHLGTAGAKSAEKLPEALAAAGGILQKHLK
ncbi:MAG: alanine--tRNA ligase [Candidatus Zixiibacteriota bacterium]|nr:MAG: alanine--tRNA ligase [candidate division Zixibacteria bacterium]